MAPERLTSLDASFLYLETPVMHMHVAGVSVVAPRADGPLTYEDVQRVVEARMHLAPRLRQRVLPVPGNLARPLWADDERFDLDFHLRRAAIRRRADGSSSSGRWDVCSRGRSTGRSRCGSSTCSRGSRAVARLSC